MADNQRQIKFRAWDGDLREMHTVSAVFFEACLSPLGTKPYLIDGHNDLHDLDEIVLMQFTGLLDVNGVEIFEGDIVNASGNGSDYVVKFGQYPGEDERYNQGFFVERLTSPSGYKESMGDAHLFLTVIGNIHQHPHLLTEAK